MAHAGPVIAARDLRFAYRGAPLLLDIPALAVEPGETVFVYGPSGCGKSTLLNLLAGTLAPAAGSIRVAGQELSALGGAARDRVRGEHVGFVFQQFNLLPFMTVLDNVLLPCRFSARRRERAVARHGSTAAAAHALLAALGLGEAGLAGRRAGALSVGQQQRVAAARALIGEPEVVMADEPTSALDADSQHGFVELLFAQCARTRAALLFVSHDRRLAERFVRTLDLSTLNRAARPAASHNHAQEGER